jgi:8-oxo-dGTP diphosphatase
MGPVEPQPKVILGGIGIIRRGGYYLIRRRPEGTVYAGYWEFPGGKCEPDETPEQATVRECREETGLDVVAGRLRRIVEHTYPHGRVRLAFFDCEPCDPTAEPEPGHGCRWVRPSELEHYRFPEANEEILRDLREEGEGSSPERCHGDEKAAITPHAERATGC